MAVEWGKNTLKKIRYYTRIYFMLAAQYLKQRMQFRADFVMEIFGMLIVNLVEFLTFWVVFHSITELGGWNFYEMLFLYGFSLMAMSPQQLLLDNGWSLSHKVVTGDFLKYCFRPMNLLFYFMSETVDVKGFSQWFLGIVMFVYSWNKLGIPVTFVNILLLLVFMSGAVLICMGLLIFSCAFGFMGGATNAAMVLASDLKGYSRYPLTVFHKAIRIIFTVVIPVGFVAYYPASFFVKAKENIPVIVYFSPVIGMIFFLLTCKFWLYHARKYAGTGS